MHFHYALFADILRDLAKTTAAFPALPRARDQFEIGQTNAFWRQIKSYQDLRKKRSSARKPWLIDLMVVAGEKYGLFLLQRIRVFH
jgi:hypothetical protein